MLRGSQKSPGYFTLSFMDLLFYKPKLTVPLAKEICPGGNGSASKKTFV